jgi:hypothetical protein
MFSVEGVFEKTICQMDIVHGIADLVTQLFPLTSLHKTGLLFAVP